MRLVVAVLVLAQISSARADDPQREQDKATAEAMGREGRRLADPQRLLDCGTAWIDIYNKDPVAADFDEVLFKSAQCFDDAHGVGAALQVYRILVQYAPPQSQYVGPSRARLGALYEQVGMLDNAAEHLEKAATANPGEKGAKDGLLQAIRLRALFGQPAQHQTAINLFSKQYGATDVARAIELSLTLSPLLPAPARLTHLREHLKRYGEQGGDELVGRARAQLGLSLWELACIASPVDGLCLVETRGRPLPRAAIGRAAIARCAPARFEKRAPKVVEEARGLFADAEKRFARSARLSADTQQERDRMHLALADLELETSLAMPAGSQASAAAAKAEAAYASLARDPATLIAATARLGRLNQLVAARSCDQTDPALKRAIDAYDACLAKSSQLGVVDGWTRQCERERAVLDPVTFALTPELLPEVPLVAPVVEEPPIKPGPNHSAAYKDALGKLAKLIAQPSPVVPQCEAIAKQFATIARSDARSEVHVMAGLAYGRCNQVAKAKEEYVAALKLDPRDALAQSSLAELDYRAGRLDSARAGWETAIKTNGKLFGARLGLAALELRALRAAVPSTKLKLSEEARFQASNAAAMVPTSTAPFVTTATVWLHQQQFARARYFVGRASAIKRGPELDLLEGSVLAGAGDPGAIAMLERAAKSGGDLAALALGTHQLALRRYADAAATLAAVKVMTYEVLVARGVAARGQGKLADAEARYAAAILFDAKRPEAHFNRGVLFKDYIAARSADPAAAKAAFAKAAEAFRKANTPEAKLLATDCDKAAI